MEDKIINRIKKMLSLANNEAATEGERDNAMRMAYNLLAKHNLTMATVEGHSNEEKREKNRSEFYGRPWALTVAQSIANLFFCEYFYMRSGTRNQVYHYFVGKESNSITALEMSKYLVDSIKRESNRRMREAGEGAAYRRSFASGAAHMVRRRVNELKAEATRSHSSGASTGTSLVLSSLYDTEEKANKSFLEESGVQLKNTRDRSKTEVDLSAYNSGHRFGGTLNLNRQLTSGKKTDLLTQGE